jgi:hypothetical protein
MMEEQYLEYVRLCRIYSKSELLLNFKIDTRSESHDRLMIDHELFGESL